MIQKNLLKILFVEDVPSDVDLAVMALRKEKIKFEYTTVCTRVDMVSALKELNPDLIISDYMMPSFNGLLALKEAKEFNSEIPFILYTGSVNEETAVACLKAGAQDYIIKEHMTRLPYAVKEAVEQVRKNKENRASELLLKENEEKLQSIFSVAPVGIGLVVDRVFIEVNDTFCNMTGYTRRELIGKSSEIIYSSGAEYTKAGEEKYRQIAEKGTGSVETSFKCKDGKILNVLLSSAPLDTNDLSKGVTFTVLDITSRKLAEEALHESEDRFRALYNDAIVGLYRTNSKGEILLANHALVKMLGFQSFEELTLINLNTSEIGTTGIPQDRQKFIKLIESTGAINDLESIWICKDGREIYVRESAKAIYGSDGKILWYDGTVEDITLRKKIEEALRESQQLFETLALVSPVGIFRTDPDGQTTYVNPRWLELSGLTSVEAMGFEWLKAIHPDDRGQLDLKWKSDVQSQISSTAEYRFLRPDGSIVWVMGNAVPEVINNEIVGYIGTITDITERKLTEEALAESELKYRQLVMRSPDGIFIIDLSGKFISLNKTICDTLKYSEEELLSMNLLNIIPEKYHNIQKQRMMAIFKGESLSSNAEYDVIGKDKIVHTIEVMSAPYYKGKEIIGFQGIARDITERKRSEQLIRESEEKYRSIFENVQDVYYETSTSGIILEVSPSINILSKGQYQMNDLIGKPMADFYAEPKERQVILSELKSKGAITDFEVTFKNKDGSPVPCSISAKLIFNQNGFPEKTIGSMHDITDRRNVVEALKLAKEKAEASDKLKTSFLNNISHEVRTPLNGILGFAEIMSQPDLSEVDKKDSLLMLNESSDRLLNTITNYMDISLVTSGNLSVYKKDIIPGKILRRIFDNFETKCSNKKLELVLKIPEQTENLTINSDPEIILKIISHLLNNAIKFTEKGSIHFGYQIHESVIEFFVKDTGIGIGKESIEIVFDNFVKEDRGQYRITEGSGLGLSISKGMTESIGGKIHVESVLGEGSCFYVEIPLANNTLITPSGIAGNEVKILNVGKLILVAEDDETNFYYLNALLSRETGATVLHASNGREAIELFEANPGIKLILMDIKMPEIDGFEATRQIRLTGSNVCIIAITAYAMSGDEEKIIAAGCDAYISKPINKKILLKKIAEFVNIR
jgi:PAS domain S-box-containing protein